jgi:carboxylesterase type B
MYICHRAPNDPYIQVHGSDLIDAFFHGGQLQDHIIRFARNLDPNDHHFYNPKWPKWPTYTTKKPNQLIILDERKWTLGQDTYRKKPMQFFNVLAWRTPI